MKLVKEALAQKGFNVTDLSDELQGEYHNLHKMLTKYIEACEEFDADPQMEAELETKLNDQEDYLVALDTELANKIIAYLRTPATPQPLAAKEGKERTSSLGWIVLTALAVVTISGYIYVLKKK